MAKFIDLDTGLPALLNKVKAWVNSKLTAKQDALTFDNVPTANSNNPVKSGGVKTALDAKANAADVPTNQDMADAIDDALGEAQVAVVPAGSVGIISSLGSDSNSDALSASMGKKLKAAIITVLNSLGNYAFPDGKPIIDWADDTPVTYTVSKTIGTGLSATGGDTDVNDGDPLEVTIAITDNLYIVDDNNVEVTMGGSIVQGAWNASTMKVTIAAVTGDVVINVPSMTYVQDGLAFQLDGLNRGGTAGHWIDRIGSVDFTMSNVTENSDNVVFGSNSTATAGANDAINIDAFTATCEVGYKLATPIASGGAYSWLRNKTTDKTSVGLMYSAQYGLLASCWTSSQQSGIRCPLLPSAAATTGGYLSFKIKQGNTPQTAEEAGRFNGSQLSGANVMFGMGERTSIMLCHNGTAAQPGTLYYLRIYSRHLSDAEILQNYKVDQKRFNIS